MKKLSALILFINTLMLISTISCVGNTEKTEQETVFPNPNPPHPINYDDPPIKGFPNFKVANGKIVNNFITNDMFNINQLGIAYSNYNSNSSIAAKQILNMAGLISTKDGSVCTAIPIKQTRGLTIFITAAHCFTLYKNDKNNINKNNFYPLQDVSIYYGQQPDISSATDKFTVVSGYLPNNYCQGATFESTGINTNCPLFDYKANTEQNDIGILVVNGNFGTESQYPHLIPLESYPQVYTNAPILSIGYGTVNDIKHHPVFIDDNPQAFYVSNYYYMTDDHVGYHHVYNSYFNPFQQGYTSLICGGDSGGPDLFWNGKQWNLISEHSFGPAGICGGFFKDLHDGNVATKVGDYFSWINNIINSIDSADNSFCDNASNNCVQAGQI